MNNLTLLLRRVDWILLFSVAALVLFGMISMKNFEPGAGAQDYFFTRQAVWLFLGILVFFGAALVDWSFLKTNSVFLLILYALAVLSLAFLLVGGETIRGATSWYRFYSAQIEPVELMKPILVLVLAKYFSKRHVEIARVTNLLISGLYAALPTVLVMLQPDLGSAFILVLIWIGMALVAGIKFRHLLFLAGIGVLAALFVWSFVFLPYQKERIVSFLNPYSDVEGSGYHALQSVIAVGSGGFLGKGIGQGTQSRLEFLPEHETDFIFSAFAEEMGLAGVLALFSFFALILWRVLRAGIYAESNFEKLYAAGLAILIFSQASVHLGMNVGILPITGLGMPFLSYGGSSLVSLFLGLGILAGFSAHKKGVMVGSEERFKEGILGA